MGNWLYRIATRLARTPPPPYYSRPAPPGPLYPTAAGSVQVPRGYLRLVASPGPASCGAPRCCLLIDCGTAGSFIDLRPRQRRLAHTLLFPPRYLRSIPPPRLQLSARYLQPLYIISYPRPPYLSPPPQPPPPPLQDLTPLNITRHASQRFPAPIAHGSSALLSHNTNTSSLAVLEPPSQPLDRAAP